MKDIPSNIQIKANFIRKETATHAQNLNNCGSKTVFQFIITFLQRPGEELCVMVSMCAKAYISGCCR